MARQNLNFFEQHVEKLTVGLAAALLLWVAYAFLVKSPNTVDLDGKALGPREIDPHVRETAERLLRQYAGAKAEPVEVTDYAVEQQRLAQGPLRREDLALAASLRRSVSFGLPVPEIEGLGSLGQVTLATLAPPEKPEVIAGRISASFPPRAVPIGEGLTDKENKIMELKGPEDRVCVTVTARIDLEKQAKVLLDHNYQTNRFKIVSADVELQRSKRLPDGTWGSWEDVADFNPYYMDAAPTITLAPDANSAQGYAVPADQQQALGVWYGNLVEFEIDLVRPRLPLAQHGPKWQPPLAGRLTQLYPAEGWTYEQPESTEDKKPRRLSPLQQARQDLETARTQLAAGALEEAKAAVERVMAGQLSKRHPLRAEADELHTAIVEAIQTRRLREITEEAADEQGEPVRTEEIYLAHDLDAEPGEVYRYRMRFQAFNQYATILQRLANPQDATRVYVLSEWSQPTEPVAVPQIQYVYLASAKDDKLQAQFDLFRWYKGQWVDASFRTDLGERIAGSRKVQHPELGRIQVEFDAGAVFMNLNTEKIYVPAKSQRDGSVRLGPPETTVAATCRKDDGGIVELLLANKNDEQRQAIEDEIEAATRGRKPKSPAPTPTGERPRGGGGQGGGGGRGGG